MEHETEKMHYYCVFSRRRRCTMYIVSKYVQVHELYFSGKFFCKEIILIYLCIKVTVYYVDREK